MDLEQLVLRFKNKEVSAFEEIYRMYSSSMHGVILNIVRNDAIAEEVLQDVFIKAWKNAETYSPEKGRMFTWLLNISRNAAIDKIRSKNYKQQKQNSSADFLVDIFGSHDDLNERVNGIGLRTFIENIGELCKSLIDQLYFQGYTQQACAEELNIPLGTVKTNIRKCILKLRELILK